MYTNHEYTLNWIITIMRYKIKHEYNFTNISINDTVIIRVCAIYLQVCITGWFPLIFAFDSIDHRIRFKKHQDVKQVTSLLLALVFI